MTSKAEREKSRFISSGVSAGYRSAAGLPERDGDKTHDPAKPDEVTIATEPEGGYGGKDGISNVSSVNESEERRNKQRAESSVDREPQTETVEGYPMESDPELLAKAEESGEVTTTTKPAKKTAKKS